MTQKQVNNIVKAYIDRKGIENFNGHDYTEIREKYGADGVQVQNAYNYWKFGKGQKGTRQ